EADKEEDLLKKIIPPEYQEFSDVFSEGSAKELPPHRSYDHKIDLEEGTKPPFGKVYNMSEVELKALKDYLDEMLGKGFIRASSSSQEERWIPSTLCGLSRIESDYPEKSISHSPYWRSY
ncbi:hypothetical protein H0H93_002263, partial [Arthromyces matolae]